MTYSARYLRNLNANAAPEASLTLLELSHPTLTEPVRVVNDSDDFPYAREFTFAPDAVYAQGQVVVPTAYNGRHYVCTVGGAAGASEPPWTTALASLVVSGAATFRCEGFQYKAVAFRAKKPDDKVQQLPRARLAIDNAGRELAPWIEMSKGGKGATVRMMEVLRSDPGTIEWEITLDLRNVVLNMQAVEGDLGFEDLLGQPAVALRYDPQTAPGLH